MKLFLVLLLGVVIFACKKSDLDPETTTLVVKVQDDIGLPIPGNSVQVYLFDDSTDFRNAWQNGIYGTAIKNQLLSGSQTTFTDLSPDDNYWVLVEYSKNVSGKTVRMNNFYTQNTLKNLLEDGATTTVVIALSPYQTGNVAFFSTDLANQDDLSVEVFFDNNWVGTLTNLSSTAPTSLADPNIVRVLYEEEGVHTYYAVGNNGCVWQGVVVIDENTGDFVPVDLSGCGFGYINFWVDDANFGSYGNVTVEFDDGDAAGVITSSRATAPGNCDKDNVLQVARPPGKYVVHAYAMNQQCVWVQTVEINEGCQNTPIEFKDCN